MQKNFMCVYLTGKQTHLELPLHINYILAIMVCNDAAIVQFSSK